MKDRLKEHEADVRLQRNEPLKEYFNGNGYSAMDVGVSVQGPVVQSIVNLTSSLRGQLVKYFTTS